MHRTPAIAVFARTPVAGKVKTRLIPLLRQEGAARLHRALTLDTLHKVSRVPRRSAKHLFLTELGTAPHFVPSSFQIHAQQGRDLGERLEKAFDLLFGRHAPILVIGTDSPVIPPSRLALALDELKALDAVLGPCDDGGYYLIGLRSPAAGVFRGVRWGGRFAFGDTLQNLLGAGLSCSVLECARDVDRPADFREMSRLLEASRSARRLSPETWKFCKEFPAEEFRPRSRRGPARSSRRRRPRHRHKTRPPVRG